MRLFGVFAEPENPCTESTLGFSEPAKNHHGVPTRYCVLVGLKDIKFSPFTTSEKTAGYPAVSYFLVTSSSGVPAGYFVPAGLIVSVLQCVRHSIRGPQKILLYFWGKE